MKVLNNWQRSHMCGEVTSSLCDKEVTLMGWVQKRRNLGGLIFIDLRDRSGIVQLALDPNGDEDTFKLAEKTRSEYVIAIRGVVQKRPEGQVNENMSTGEIEVHVSKMTILNSAETPPFYIVPDVNAEESLRLKYRYLDLRRPDIQNAIVKRHKITKVIRDFLDDNGFLEIETPILTKSTPEGARDYLVPSRVNSGSFYALPQSPQIFKQLLMVGGYDRYFQIARCFRDEDLRADRQPEFTQVDIEMSFVTEENVRSLAEGMVKSTFYKVLNIDLGEKSFMTMPYEEAINKYGSDKPDIRFEMTIKDISEVLRSSNFRVFQSTLDADGVIKGITVKGQSFSRKQIDSFTDYVKKYGAKGLVWISYGDDGVRSSVAKFLSEAEIEGISKQMGAEKGDTVFIIASEPAIVHKALGALRLKLGEDLNLIDKNQWAFLWVVDFPLLEYDENEKRYTAAHHPFTMPKEEDIELLNTEPQKVRAKAYDLVLNGVEIGGGSIRIHDNNIQKKMFQAIGFSEDEAINRFGFFIESLKYGTPPHGGIAFGLDRLVMEMLHLTNIRDVIAFPKTTSASCLMSNAPGEVSQNQLHELNIQLLNK